LLSGSLLLAEAAAGALEVLMLLATHRLPEAFDAVAPDGSEVRILSATGRGSMAHFRLPPGAVSQAVAHRTVEEIWYIVAGRGRMWRKVGEQELVVDLSAGTSIAIPVGAHFQFRADGGEPLDAVGVTMPPWPGEEEAYAVEGPWRPASGG
jgi:mannose-6-phosphate isomerase-like protein (cupin superfamily)